MISVIVPIYNVEKYLNRCLDSIKNQTYTDFEVLMIDDGSTDRSQEIARNYQNDTRFKLFIQTNQGQGAARNLGLDNIKGDYICFIDSDDYVEEKYLEILFNALIMNDADISQCGVMRVWEDGRKVNLGFQDNNEDVYTDIKGYIQTAPFSFWNKIYKAELFDGLRFPAGIKFEDFALAPQVYSRAKKIVSVPDRLYNYLWRNNSTTTSVRVQPDILKAQHILEDSEFGINNPDIMEIFFIRQVMGSLLWAMNQCEGYENEIKIIVDDALKKYPQIRSKINDSTIGNRKTTWGKMLLDGHYQLAAYYSKAYTMSYNTARKLYHWIKR